MDDKEKIVEFEEVYDFPKVNGVEKVLNYPTFNSIEELAKSNSYNDLVNESNLNEIESETKMTNEDSYIEIEDKGETKSYYVFGYGFYSYHTFQISLISKSNTRLLSFRRYKHFFIFSNFMRYKYPYLLFPDLPPKNILGNLSINMKSKEDLEKERIFGLTYFLNYFYKNKSIKDSIEFKKFLYDAYFDENFFEQVQPFYTFPIYEEETLKGKMYNYFTSFFMKNQLIVHNKEEMEVLFIENELRTMYRWLVFIKDQYDLFEKIIRDSEKNCKDFITDFMLMKDVNCFSKKEKHDFSNYSVKMQNLKSLYYYNLENIIKKPLDKMKELIYLLKGIFIQIESLKEFLISFRKFNNFMLSNDKNTNDFKKDFETLVIKKNYFILNLQEDLTQFCNKNKGTVEDYISDFIEIYFSTTSSVN